MKTLLEWFMAFDREDRPVLVTCLIGFVLLGVLL